MNPNAPLETQVLAKSSLFSTNSVRMLPRSYPSTIARGKAAAATITAR